MNLNIIYDDRINIWWNNEFRQVLLNPSLHITAQQVPDELSSKGFKIEYDYKMLNLTGKIIDMRTST